MLFKTPRYTVGPIFVAEGRPLKPNVELVRQTQFGICLGPLGRRATFQHAVWALHLAQMYKLAFQLAPKDNQVLHQTEPMCCSLFNWS